LLSRYRQPSGAHQSAHLDDNVASIPDLAVRALTLELNDMYRQVRHLLTAPQAELERHIDLIQQRINQVHNFVGQALKSELTQSHSALLAAGLSAAHHLNYAARALENIHEQRQLMLASGLSAPSVLSRWQTHLQGWLQQHERLASDRAAADFEPLKSAYATLKSDLINAAANAQQPIGLTDAALTEASFSRRFAEQLVQVDDALHQLGLNLSDVDGEQPVTATGAADG
jgi:phosphate:Na+ symporter